jgi:transcriptional regulator with PAS, ATPase and Fis domain
MLLIENKRLYDLSQRELAERRQAEAKLKETLAELGKSHEDLLAVLDQLRLATVVTDEHGEITFLSRAGQRILRKSQSQAAGRHWVEFFPFQEKEKAELKAMSERPTRRRTKVPAHMEVPGGCHYWFEVDVCDDPRDPRKKVFYLYDISDVHNLRRQMDDRDQFFDLIGGSESMQRLYQQIREVSSVDWTVLIEGETGSGKELVARAIHLASDRKGKPFIAVNCAGLLEALLASQLFGHRRGAFTGAVEDHLGFFEAASGGTLFLDEIGDVPMNIQSNLLRAIELKEITRLGESTTHKIDVRLLAATNRDLNLAVKEGTFRADLLYRIRVARILIPPLRERREDIPLLVGMFLGRCCAETGKQVWELNSEAMRMLSQYDWPGNVRELKATIECAVIHVKGSVIKPKDLPPEILASFQPGTNADDASRDEKQKIMDALKDAGGSRVRAARLLGMSRSTLYRRLAEISATPQK